MAWFSRKPLVSIRTLPTKAGDGLWIKCDGCHELSYKQEVERNLQVCPKCGHHFRIGARARIEALVDPASFEERDAGLRSLDPLLFRDEKAYPDRLRAASKATGLADALVVGQALLGGHRVGIGALEFAFLGGSMASVVGEKIARAAERAVERRTPLILCTCSGGARMQEGTLSLMQMAKTSAALGRLGRAGLPYVSVLCDPTTGGVTASFAMLGDLILAEPKALIGFAGPRVIQDTIRQELPPGFQRAEFLLDHGFIDMLVDRRQMRDTLIRLLDWFSHG